jgi:hypothetical protein
LIGRFKEFTDDSLHLRLPGKDTSLAVSQIQALWERGRATKKGLFIGGISLSIAGGALGVLAVGLGSMESPEDPNYLLGFLGGAALGFAGGGSLGAGVGSTVEKWHSRYRSPGYIKTTGRAELPSTRIEVAEEAWASSEASSRIGGFSIQGGFAREFGSDAANGSVGGRIGLVSQISSRLTVGPEFGYFSLGSDNRFWHAGAVIRWGKPSGTKYYYGLFCLSIDNSSRALTYWSSYSNSWYTLGNNHTHVGYGFGGGIRYNNKNSSLSYGLEGRWQSNLSRLGSSYGPLSIVTVTANMKYAW